MKKEITEQDRMLLKKLSAEEILRWSVEKFGSNIVFASSMGLEDQVMTHMIIKQQLNIDIFTLDTGRLFNETYKLIDVTEKRYGVKIKVYFPDASDVERMTDKQGVNLFYKGEKERKQCCHIRKLNPLKRALIPYSAWICGLRKKQSVTRGSLQIADRDEANSIIKINPLINWTEKNVWDYVKKHKIPYNKLHDQGFLSIGCSCCTRAVKPGDDARSGRWWWEPTEQKECGLHMIDGKIVRKKLKLIKS